MMRIAVISDTHVPRFARRLPALHERLTMERPDVILHCGDFTEPSVVAPFEALAPFDGVAGNNDGQAIVARFGRVKVLQFERHRLGLVHGDGNAGTTLGRARATFAGQGLAAILFGHSHVAMCERIDGSWLINPGSATDKRREPRFSYALIELSDVRFEPRLVFFD